MGWNFGPQGGCQALRGAEVENIVTTTVEFWPMMIMKQIYYNHESRLML